MDRRLENYRCFCKLDDEYARFAVQAELERDDTRLNWSWYLYAQN